MMMYSSQLGVIKSGVLDLVSFNSKLNSLKPKLTSDAFTEANGCHEKVVVVVYKTSSEHFAVVYPHWGLISAKRPFCIINLKRAKVERSDKDPEHEFSLLSYRDSDLLMHLCFNENMSNDRQMSDENNFPTVESWINALQAEVNEYDSCTAGQWRCLNAKRRVSKSSLLSVLNEDDSEEYGI